jgi:hypothetical protein
LKTSPVGDFRWHPLISATQKSTQKILSVLKVMKFASALVSAVALLSPVMGKLSIGVISYWGTNETLYNLLPANQNVVALINLDSGIFTPQTTTLVPDLASYQAIVTAQKARGVNMIGYVPTGYGNHSCNIAGVCQTKTRIQAQVQSYFQQMPDLAGIFFDEAAFYSDSLYASEFALLRSYVAAIRSNATIVFNTGYASMAAAQALMNNGQEAFVAHESTYASFLTYYADIAAVSTYCASNKSSTWVLIHTLADEAQLNDSLVKTAAANASYYYGTNIGGNWQAGDPTWNVLPSFWDTEITLLQSFNNQNVNVSSTAAPTSKGALAFNLNFVTLIAGLLFVMAIRYQ